MKRLGLVVIVILVLVTMVTVGCTSTPVPAPGEEVSTCVQCHSDKDLLKEVASPEEEAESEETSGEG